MKTKILLLTLFSFFFLNSNAQNIIVNITTSGHDDPRVCSSTHFNVEIILPANATSALQFGIQKHPDLTYSNNPTPGNINGIDYKLYPINCAPPCTTIIGFDISYACNIIPSVNGQLVSLIHSLIIANGPNQYQGHVNWAFNNNPVNAEIGYEVKYFYMALQGSLGPVISNMGRPAKRYIAFQNNGNIDFDGALNFHDYFSCDDYSLSGFNLYEVNGTDTVPIDSLAPPGGTSPDHNFTYTFNNNPIEPGHQLLIRENLQIISCLQCGQGTMSTFEVTWGCPGNLCRSATVSPSNVLRSTDRPKLTMYRILPVPSGNYPNNGYWDQTGCSGDVINWKYRIGNDGSDIAYNVSIDLHNPDPAFVFLIDLATVFIEPCTNGCNGLIFPEDIALRETLDVGQAHIKCAETMQTPLIRAVYKIPQLKPGQYVTISFSTKYCCPGLNDGTDINPLVLDFFDPLYFEKSFNTWLLDVSGKDECDLLGGFISDNPPTNMYKTFHNIGQFEHWHMEQILDVTTSDMTGITCPGPACSEGNPIPFHIENKNLNSELLNHPNLDYRLNATPFCIVHNTNPEMMPMNVKIKLVFKMEEALRLFPLDDDYIYIQNGANKWKPSLLPLNDLCDGNPIREYEVVFDGANLATVLGLQGGLDLKNFMYFINGSVTTFNLIPCCCSANGNPEFTVKTYIQGTCTTCWIPLTQINSNVHVHCPGCITPGVETIAASLVRDASSLGYPDAENDGLKDSNQQIDLSTYSAAPDMKLNRSIQGDILVSTVSGIFFDSNGAGCLGGAGMDYNTLKQLTCNTTSCASTLSTTYEFRHLYLDQTIPYSEPSKFNLQLKTCTLTVTRQAQQVVYILSQSEIDDINNIHHVGSQFLFDFTPTMISNGTGLFASGFAFTPGETYTARMTYKVCNNFSPAGFQPVDNKHMSEILNAYYFAVTDLPQLPFQSRAQFTDHYDTGIACDGLCHTDIFQCQTFTSLHYFYSIHTRNSSAILDYNQPTANGDITCNKTLYAIADVNMGGFAQNIFPYEFRPAPVVNSFNLTIPTGYRIVSGTPRWGTEFHTYGECYPSAYEISRIWNVTTPSQTGTFIMPVTTVDAGPNMGLNEYCEHSQDLQVLIKGDEHCRTSLFMLLEPDNCPLTPASVSIASSYIQVNFDKHDCGPPGTETKDMSCASCGILHKSNPQLNLTQINTPTVSTTQFTIDVKFTNPPFSSTIHDYAENTFLYFPTSSNYTVESVVCLTAGQPLPIHSGDFWRLNSIVSGATVDYRITFELTQCTGTPGSVAIPFNYGWNCVGYPTLITDPKVCSNIATNLNYIESASNVDNTIKINDLTGSFQYKLCTNDKFEVKIKSLEFGGIHDIRVSVVLPNQMVFSSTLPELKYCTTGNNCQTNTLPAPTGNSYIFVLNPPPATNGYLSNGDELTLTFYLQGQCGYQGVLPEIKVKASRFCDNNVPLEENMTQGLTWTYSGTNNCSSPNCTGFSASANSTNVSCFGFTNGTATVTTTAGTPPFSYLWNTFPAQSNPPISNLSPGTYTCTVTDACGCTASAFTTVSQPNALSILMSSVPTCPSAVTGTATATPSGGTAPYAYLWSTSPPQSGPTASILAAGNYTCTVTDNNGCTNVGNISVTTNPAIVLSSPNDLNAIIPTSAAGASDGEINLSVSGGTPPYTYNWSLPAISQDITGLSSGYYTVTVTDASLCTATQIYFIPEPNSECDAGFATYTQGGYGNCGFPGQFMASNFDGHFATGLNIGCQDNLHNTLAAGCYQAIRNFIPSGTGPQVLNTDYSNPIKSGCSFIGNCVCTTGQYCVPSNPIVYRNVFAGQVMTLTLNLGFDGSPGFSTNSYPFSNLYFVGSGQFYGLTVGEILDEANARLGGCTTTVSFSYTTSELNNVVDLINKSWDNGQCPNGSCGILSCLGSSSLMNMSSMSTLSSTSDLQAACMPYNPSCVNGYSGSILTTVHGGTPPYSYLWNTGDTDPDLTDLTPGIYIVTVTDDDANSVIRYAYINSDATIDHPTYYTENITGLTSDFTDNSTAASSGAVQSWQWNFGDPSSGSNTSSTQNPSHTFSGDGAYNVCLSITYTSNLSNCADTYCSTVCITPQVTASPSSVSFCNGSGATLTATVSGTNSYTYQWMKDGNAISSQTSSTYYATTAGSYTCVVSNSCGSSTTNALIVTVNDLPDATISAVGSTTICSGYSVTLNANTGTGITYQWKLNGNIISSATSASYSATASGDYNVVVTNICGSVTSNTINITVNPLLPVSVSISATATTICSGSTVTFTATPVNGGSSPSYQWTKNGSAVGTNNTTYVSSLLSNSDVIACVLTSNITPCATGNPATSNSITIIVNPLPEANTGSNQNVCSGEPVALGAAPVAGNTYSWSPTTSLSSATVSNPTFTSSTAGTTNYTLTETVTATGCYKSNGVSVTVISGGGNPTFTCNNSNLVVATPYTTCVSPGSNDYLVMQVKITLGGGCSGAQRKLQTLKFNAASATCSNIENAKLWYSGNSNSFSNAQIVSGSGTLTSVSCNSNNTWNAGTLKVMQPGDNYFWVTYKIRSTATIGETVLASLVSVTVVANGNSTCSTFGGSTSARTIQSSGCTNTRFEDMETQPDPENISISVHPNPFTEQTTIQFISTKDDEVLLELYDISGQKLETLFFNEVKAGEENEVEMLSSGMGAGIYYYRLSTRDDIYVGKLMIVK